MASWCVRVGQFTPLLSLCYPELLLLRKLSVVWCGVVGTETGNGNGGAEKITTSYWSLGNKLSADWLIKSASKHRN